MLKTRTVALLALALVAGVTAFSTGTTSPASAQTPPATVESTNSIVKAKGPSGSVKPNAVDVPVTVSVEDVENLGGFQFQMTFDTNVVDFVEARKGAFLGSTGREIVCNPQSDAGVVRFSCVSLRPAPPGPNGSGELATVVFKSTGIGVTDITLDRVKLVTVAAAEIPVAQVTNASVKVSGSGGGFEWMIWGPVIGVAGLLVVGAGAFVATRRRARNTMGDVPEPPAGEV